MTYITAANFVNPNAADLKWIIKASELRGLAGVFRPFNDESFVEISVKQADNLTFVDTGINQIALNSDDWFILTNNGHARLLRGPSRFTHPFEKVIAQTVLNPYTILRFTTEAIRFEHKKHVGHTSDDHTVYNRVPFNARVCVIRFSHGAISKIVVRPTATDFDLEWLYQYCLDADLVRQPSGAFKVFTDQLVETEAEIIENDRKLAARQAYDEYYRMVRQVQEVTKPTMVQVGHKKFTINNGNIHPGAMVGGKKLDLNTLYNNGILPEILNALKPRSTGTAATF